MEEVAQTLRNQIADMAVLISRQEIFSEILSTGKIPDGYDEEAGKVRGMLESLENLCSMYSDHVNGPNRDALDDPIE